MDDANLTMEPGLAGAVPGYPVAFRALVLATVASWTGTGWLPAQDPPQEPPGVTLEIEGEYISFAINESAGLPILDFIKLAERLTGKVFTFDRTGLLAATPTGSAEVTFIGTVRMRREDFFSFFQTMLYIKGFACVLRGEGEAELVEIVAIQGPKRGEIQSGARYVPPEDIPQYAGQTGVTILTSVPLQHIQVQVATNSLRPFFAQSSQVGAGLTLGNVGNNAAMLLQGYGPQVNAAYQLLRLVDVPQETVDLDFRVVRLEHAAPEELREVLDEILNDRQSAIPQGVTGGALGLGQRPRLKIVAQPHLGSLILSGAPEQIVEAQDLIARLDVPIEADAGDIHVIRLKNVLAQDLRDTLDQFLQQDLQAEQRATAGQGAAASTRQERRTVIQAHAESNSILISGSPTKYLQVRRLIDELDERQPQVLIEAALVELRTSDLSQFGVELAILDIGGDEFTRGFGFTSFGLSTFEDTDGDGLPDSRLPDINSPLQGVTGGILSSDDFAIPFLLNALAQDELANILSMPSVVVNNNEAANVDILEERITTTVNQGTATTQSGAGPPREAGISLSISPTISSSNYLRLNILMDVSRFITTFDPADPTGGPKLSRTIQTQVTLPSGDTMVFGGVVDDAESEARSGVPILQDIPLIGWLFQTGRTETIKTNLYFFVTPTILDEDDFSDLAQLSWRKKLEAAEYIGHQRMQLVDRKWRQGRPETLEDSGATIEDLDAFGGFEIPYYERPSRDSGISGPPVLPNDRTDRGEQTGRPDRGGGH
jgi:general secretion pathway protein D